MFDNIHVRDLRKFSKRKSIQQIRKPAKLVRYIDGGHPTGMISAGFWRERYPMTFVPYVGIFNGGSR